MKMDELKPDQARRLVKKQLKIIEENNALIQKLNDRIAAKDKQLKMQKISESKVFSEFKAYMAALLELKIEDLNLSNIPMAQLEYRLLLLNLEAIDPESPPSHRLNCINRAETIMFKRDNKEQAKERYKAKKIPEAEEQNEMEFESEFTEGLDNAEGNAGTQAVRETAETGENEVAGGEDLAAADGPVAEDRESSEEPPRPVARPPSEPAPSLDGGGGFIDMDFDGAAGPVREMDPRETVSGFTGGERDEGPSQQDIDSFFR